MDEISLFFAEEHDRMYHRIEFIGLPGSGKSTLANLLMADLKQRHPSIYPYSKAVLRCLHRRDDGLVRNFLKLLPYKFWEPFSGTRNALPELHAFASDNIPMLRIVFEVLQREDLSSDIRKCVLYVFFSLGSEHQLFSSYLESPEGVVHEEGFAQGSLSLFGYLSLLNINQKDIDRYIEQLPLLSGVACVMTPPEICLQRLFHRLQLPLILSGKPKGEQMDRMAHLNHCMRLTLEAMENRGVKTCKVYNTDGNLEKAAQEIKDVCSSWMQNNEK